ncbi:hypothetical protein [Silvibacterium acidisoli]|uniref:hypothetical protein n=1 Tax=Acidobacteriaceae bacterium ZG23-2 TaxID=2883246 RepID=UPI00406C8E86
MLAAITTVHAAPKFVLAKAVSIKASTVVCRDCSQVLGSATNPIVHQFLQDTHVCSDKRAGMMPTVAVPFS